jgi:Fic family protein
VRSFQWPTTLDPVPGDVVKLLARIDRAAGAEGQYRDQLPHLMTGLAESARIESITASSAIEGVFVDSVRLPGLASGSTTKFRNRSEAEFVGYRTALDYLYAGDQGPLSLGLILHLHRLLLSFADGGGGRLKLHDNLVVEGGEDRKRRVRFTPITAQETPHYMTELVERTNLALADATAHPLIVVAAFTLDLSCIHPFADGNGRVARLATSLLLGRVGYSVGRYISIERLIFEHKDAYYTALGASTVRWFDDGQHTLWPWARYLFERLGAAYDRFEARVAAETGPGNKQDRVRAYVLSHGPARFRITDIRSALPGISDQTIRLVLAELKSSGLAINDGPGRSASWSRITSP